VSLRIAPQKVDGLKNHPVAKRVCKVFCLQYQDRLSGYFKVWKSQMILSRIQNQSLNVQLAKKSIMKQIFDEYLRKLKEQNKSFLKVETDFKSVK